MSSLWEEEWRSAHGRPDVSRVCACIRAYRQNLHAAWDGAGRRWRNPTVQLSGVVPIGKAGGRTYQDELVVFSYAAEAICSPVAADLVKGDARDEGRMSLASCYHPLLPWREDGNKVILPTRLRTGLDRGQMQCLYAALTRMNRPSGDQATHVNAPK